MNDSGGATTGERLHALDLVRAGALLLGIVFHAAIPFLPEFDLWLVLDQVRSRPVGWLTFTLHTFRMTTFFLLAGYFGRMLLVRRGASGFIRDRSKRILAPLVIFWLPVLLLYGLALALAVYLGATPAGSELAEPPALTVDAWPLMHLWFLYVLLILYAAVLIVRSAVAAVDRGGKLRGAVDRMLATALRLPLVLPLLLALPVMALLLNQPEWAEFWGIPTPEIASTWSSMPRCCPVTQTRLLKRGSASSAWINGNSLMASGRVPKTVRIRRGPGMLALIAR